MKDESQDKNDSGAPDDEQAEREGVSRWMRILMLFAYGPFLLVALLSVYHFKMVKPQLSSFATVDISAPVRHREAQFTALLSGKEVSDRDRETAYRLVQSIGPEIEKAVATLQAECRCTILVKSAVVAGSGLDLTPRLLELMGIKAGAVQ